MKTNLDRIQESEIDLHEPSSRGDHGLRRSDRDTCEIDGSVIILWRYIPQERISQAIDTYEDRPAQGLTQRT